MTKYDKAKKNLLNAPHLFALLGVHKHSTQSEVSAARRELAAVFHPDRNDDPMAHDLMSKINDAHRILTVGRVEYMMRISQKPCEACKGNGSKKKQQGFTKSITVICPTCQGSGRQLTKGAEA